MKRRTDFPHRADGGEAVLFVIEHKMKQAAIFYLPKLITLVIIKLTTLVYGGGESYDAYEKRIDFGATYIFS
ncbi:hypothetical protein P9314_26180 [Paenibacillus validus]|uniref:hypothetical protein n=1 Tax=Paenibacillus validus TaxID=44253 RepID=UPI002E1D406B|nr:hypothetical protein [Paenibacillus validus]